MVFARCSLQISNSSLPGLSRVSGNHSHRAYVMGFLIIFRTFILDLRYYFELKIFVTCLIRFSFCFRGRATMYLVCNRFLFSVSGERNNFVRCYLLGIATTMRTVRRRSVATNAELARIGRDLKTRLGKRAQHRIDETATRRTRHKIQTKTREFDLFTKKNIYNN